MFAGRFTHARHARRTRPGPMRTERRVERRGAIFVFWLHNETAYERQYTTMIARPQADIYATRSTHAGTPAGVEEGVRRSRSREASPAYLPAAASRIATGTTGTGLRGHCRAEGLGVFGQIEDTENAKDRPTVSAGTASGGRTL